MSLYLWGVVQNQYKGANDMKRADEKEYKERLLALRARLRGDMTAMAKAALSKPILEAEADRTSAPMYTTDVGPDSYEQEFTLSLIQNEEETLDMIESALERIEDGQYGICVECDGRISKARLNAIPHTPFCIKCATKIQGR
jgi:RNA polymerase-binding transcription factor DksA